MNCSLVHAWKKNTNSLSNEKDSKSNEQKHGM